MNNRKIRVLIADDHVLVREGIRALLQAQPDIEVVEDATNGEEAVSITEMSHPDVVLMDITMPVMNGLEATRQIRRHNSEVKILVLTMHEGDEYFFKILQAGASGYFVKGGSFTELISAVRAICAGRRLHPSYNGKKAPQRLSAGSQVRTGKREL